MRSLSMFPEWWYKQGTVTGAADISTPATAITGKPETGVAGIFRLPSRGYTAQRPTLAQWQGRWRNGVR
jgi:hypothetical protein